jgi:hypothetical protein
MGAGDSAVRFGGRSLAFSSPRTTFFASDRHFSEYAN